MLKIVALAQDKNSSAKTMIKGKLQNAVQEVVKRQHIDFNNERDLQEIMEILQKDKNFKSQQDIEMIRMAFCRFNFFQDLESKMGVDYVYPLYKELTYEKMLPRQTVFNLGDIGRKFYIILKGNVWVLVKKKGLQDGSLPTDQEIENEEKEKQLASLKKKKKKGSKRQTFAQDTQPNNKAFLTLPNNHRMTQQQIELQEEEERHELTDQEFLDQKFPFLQQVGTLKAGDSFGEIALTKQMPRTATIICTELTHFVTLTREAFNSLLSEYYQIIQQINVKFLQKVSMFSDWNEPMLNQLYYHFTFKDFRMNQTIYRENDLATEIYLIQEGEVEISRNIEIKMKEANESEKLLVNFVKNTSQFTCKQKRIRSALMTVGQIFGQEEVLENSKRQTMAICVSDKLKLFVLEKQRFLTYCQRGNAILKVTNTSDQKKTWRIINENTMALIEKPPMEKKTVDSNYTKQLEHKRVMSQCSFNQSNIQSSQSKDTFVVHKQANIFERVSDKDELSSFTLLQNKTHMNTLVGNFNSHFDLIQKTLKPNENLSMQSGFFDLQSSKGASISVLSRIFPGALREKYEIPKNVGKSKTHLIKHLKLPSILRHVDSSRISDAGSMISRKNTDAYNL